MIKRTKLHIFSNLDPQRLSKMVDLLEENGIKVDETDFSFEYDTENTEQNAIIASIFEQSLNPNLTYENNNS